MSQIAYYVEHITTIDRLIEVFKHNVGKKCFFVRKYVDTTTLMPGIVIAIISYAPINWDMNAIDNGEYLNLYAYSVELFKTNKADSDIYKFEIEEDILIFKE